MEYNRTIQKQFACLLEDGSQLRWLFDFAKKHDDLDLFIGKNNNKQWISLYRGLARLLTIHKSYYSAVTHLEITEAYASGFPDSLDPQNQPEDFRQSVERLLDKVRNDAKFNRYYNNKKEGYYQNELSRKLGICGSETGDMVIIDKEVVIGYKDRTEKSRYYTPVQHGYKEILEIISKIDSARYGKELQNKTMGNELDFLALDRTGNLLLIAYKHGTNTAGIYLSPLQVGMYYDLFSTLNRNELESTIFAMLEQKQKIGLINPEWTPPKQIINLVPVLIISEYNHKSTAKDKFYEILDITRSIKGRDFLKDIRMYNYTSASGLTVW